MGADFLGVKPDFASVRISFAGSFNECEVNVVGVVIGEGIDYEQRTKGNNLRSHTPLQNLC